MHITSQLGAGKWPCPGTVIAVATFAFYQHKGLVSDLWYGGKPMVISSSARAGRVCEEPWDEFAQGKPILIDGYPSGLAPYEVLRRARELIGMRYHVLNWNCEHVVSYSHGLKPQSPQVAATLLLGAAGILALAATRGR